MHVTNKLAFVVTPSTEHMSFSERRAGISQMLNDLAKLATDDGCIAAAWALEVIETVVSDELEEAALRRSPERPIPISQMEINDRKQTEDEATKASPIVEQMLADANTMFRASIVNRDRVDEMWKAFTKFLGIAPTLQAEIINASCDFYGLVEAVKAIAKEVEIDDETMDYRVAQVKHQHRTKLTATIERILDDIHRS